VPTPALLYTVFHLNLYYSSIEEAQRPQVINQCYWPLLRLARDHNVPIGIEASGCTLEAIQDIDPDWIATLRDLIVTGNCEFIGSGYAQLIGPLAPKEVNAANQRIGLQVYQDLLHTRPTIALVNEQTYSAGMVAHYVAAGYRAILMDWDNPARNNPDWPRDLLLSPQIAKGTGDHQIPVIWSHSLGFQRFQRYAHGDSTQNEYVSYLDQQTTGQSKPVAYPVYTNDAEVFNFRPGRHKTEPALSDTDEWARIEALFAALHSDTRYRLVLPTAALDLMDPAQTRAPLRLETAADPLPLKKQGKYSVIRWAVTGRDDTRINAVCWNLHAALKETGTGDDWKELCTLWSSDFRTHITDARWQAYEQRLNAFQRAVPINTETVPAITSNPTAERQGRWLDIETGSLSIRLDCDRGCTIDALRFEGPDSPSLLGTLRHGYYDDIDLGADWYTGHVVLDPPGQPKVTDLSPVDPEVSIDRDTGVVTVSCAIDTDLGAIRKSLQACPHSSTITLDYELDWPQIPLGTLRLGYVTLNPGVFGKETLHFETENGGDTEHFDLSGSNFDHGAPASSQVSARSGLGATEDRIRIGDASHKITLTLDRTKGAALPLLTHRETGDTFFCRAAFSLREIDDTLKLNSTSGASIGFRLIVSA
jgi:hypothetical protein